MRRLFQRLRVENRVESDPTHIARLLKPFLAVMMVFAGLHGAILAWTSLENYRFLLLVFHLPVLLALGFAQVLIRSGRVIPAAWLSLVVLWSGFTLGIAGMGGMQAPAFIGGHVLAVIIAAVFLGYRASLLFSLASIFSGLVLAYLRQKGMIQGPGADISIYVIWLAQACIVIAAMELMRLAALNANLSFDHSRREHKYFQSLIENSSDMVAVINVLGKMTYTSPSVERIMGFTSQELEGASSFDLVHPDDRGVIISEFSRLALKPGGRQSAEFRVQNSRGEWRWVDAAGSNFLLDPDVQGIILNYRDITERKEYERRLEHDAIHDGLTGLPNRILFLDRISSRLRRAQRDLSQSFAVLILDLDHFKNVNDSLGRDAGDDLLKEVSHRLEACLRTSDTVARLGGDEFGILLDAIDTPQGAVQTVERLLDVLRNPYTLLQREFLPEASIGLVIGPSDYRQADDTLRDAEIAMYRAKELGRARYVIFNDRMRSGVLERVGLEAEIRRALTHAEFRVYYQPIYSLKSGLLAGFEALVRWQHPERGLLLPGTFLDIAEESGLVVDLDRWVMREACQQLRVWQGDYPLGKSLIMNVNLSRKHLTRADLVDTVQSILTETGLDASCLRPEITESLFMESYADAISIVRSLDSMGVQVEIDDFGTGHSSLALLAELKEVRTLKIDRQFINSIGAGADRLEIIRMIISLGYSLKKEVIAEGIETREQLENLRSLDCEFGQGFYFSRGVSPVEAGSLIDLQSANIS